MRVLASLLQFNGRVAGKDKVKVKVVDSSTAGQRETAHGQLPTLRRLSHTHNRFTALLELVRDNLGEQVPER